MEHPIALASDHAGLPLKNHIREWLQERGIPLHDFGTDAPQSVDYSDYARLACEAVRQNQCSLALLFCSTGIGMSMAANKMRGIRACACSDAFSAEMTRRHNDANVLCLGAQVIGPGLAEKLVDIFLAHTFEGGRHERRVGKLAEIEDQEGRL